MPFFPPELKSYLITQWNCTTIGSCRCRKTNQWVGSGAARTYGDDTRQYSRRNGWGIWLYKRSFRHRILRFFLLQRRRLRLLHWSGSLLAVDTPRSRTQRPRSARLIRLQRAPASQQFRSRSLQLSSDHITSKSLKEQIGVLMPRRYCGSCRSSLHADDGHSECVS